MRIGGRTCLLCTCFRTQPVDGAAIARALDAKGEVEVVDELCRRHRARFEAAAAEGAPLLVACEQEAPLFTALAPEADLRFVDLRDSGGWSDEAPHTTPKMAALLAAASVALPPAPLLQMESAGRCVVYGEGQAALDMAMQLAGRLDVTLLVNGDTGDLLLPPRRPFAALAGRIARAQGHLGAFEIALKDTRSIAPWSRSGIAFEAGVGELTCDLVLDMSGETPLFTAFEKRDGYLHVDPADPVALQRAAFAAVDLVGTFEKPRYVALRADLCAHSRSGRTGCTRCLRHCPTGAITPAGDHVAIDPFVCAGCGSCAALCPTGAVTYAAPAPDATTSRLRELLAVYAAAGGRHPVVLLHETRHGPELIGALARTGPGLPAHVLPLALGELGQIGLDAMLAALAYGAERLVFLAGPDKAGDLLALETDIGFADAVMRGLGYGPERLTLLIEDDPDRVAEALAGPPPEGAMPRARFRPMGGKRDRLRLPLGALHEGAPAPLAILPMPAEAPMGGLVVDVAGCTLCLACVGACPTGALLDDPDKPTLRFLEEACVQCGLCVSTCPEKVIALEPRVNFGDDARSPRTIKEEDPFCCVRCGRPFGTRSSIERIVGALAARHSMFQSEDQIARLKMCEDCRVQVHFEATDTPMRAAARPPTRTTDDYLTERARAGTADDEG